MTYRVSILIPFLLPALGAMPAPAVTLHAAGSTTVLPVVSQAARAYHAAHPDVTITVSGGGSGVGIASMIQGSADIGMASRETEPEEEKHLAGRVENVVIAHDAVAAVVSRAVYLAGVHALSLKQIAAIYGGEMRNWKEVGGPDAQIVVIDKEAARGTRQVFARAVLGDEHARAAGASVIAGSNNEEQAIVARSDAAIGMLSNAWLNDRVRGLSIGHGAAAIPPTIEHVRDGSYPISRGLHVLLHKDAPAAAHDFVRFLLSPAGQEIVQKSGYLPLH